MKSLWQRAVSVQRGSVAIELALILPILAMFLFVPLFFARVFWFYSLTQKAAHDAARFLSTATQAELRTPGAAAGQARVASIADWIVRTETAASESALYMRNIEIRCGMPDDDGTISYIQCGTGVPATVRVYIDTYLFDDFFPERTLQYFGHDGLRLQAYATVRYAGN